MNVNTNPAARWPVSGMGADSRQRTAKNQSNTTGGFSAASTQQDTSAGMLISLPEPQTIITIASNDAPSASQEEVTLKDQLESMRESVRDTMQKLREAAEAGEAVADHWRNKLTALRIAMRIANGDNVPMRDHRFLMEFDSNMYNDAIRMSLVSANDEPRDYDTLTEDSSDENSAGYATHNADAPNDTAATSSEPQAYEPLDVSV